MNGELPPLWEELGPAPPLACAVQLLYVNSRTIQTHLLQVQKELCYHSCRAEGRLSSCHLPQAGYCRFPR